jgi:glucose-6-phosphate isomerase
VHKVLDSIQAFSDRVRSGDHKGCTGKPLTTVVAVGIGGSYLGPEFLFEALKCDPEASASASGRTLKVRSKGPTSDMLAKFLRVNVLLTCSIHHLSDSSVERLDSAHRFFLSGQFLANVDPVDFKRATAGLDPEATLVVIVSKTFTTAETMLNARTIRTWLLENIKGADPEAVCRHHIVACSSALAKTSQFGIDPANVFGFWDWVGGRFSIWSAVGMVSSYSSLYRTLQTGP